MSIAACLDSQTWRGTGVEGMATNQAQGKLSLGLNEARTDVTCHIDCLQLEQLCLFYNPFLYCTTLPSLPTPTFSSFFFPSSVNLCTILSPVKDFSSSFTLFSFSSTYFLLTVEAWWQFITSSVMQQLPFLLPSPTPPCVQQVPLVLSVKTFDWITIWNYSNFSLNTQHEPQATSRKPQAPQHSCNFATSWQVNKHLHMPQSDNAVSCRQAEWLLQLVTS